MKLLNVNNKDIFFIECAFKESFLSICNNPKGAVIVRDGKIISSGFNDVPLGILPCSLKYGYCCREKKGYLVGKGTGEGLQFCRAIHAEASAIVKAAKNGINIENTTLYTTHLPCRECAKLIINSGIERVVYSKKYANDITVDWFLKANISLEQIII